MGKLFLFILKLSALIVVGVWLINQPGTATIAWHDYVIETSAAVLCVLLLISAYLIYVLFRLFHLIKHGPVYWRLNKKLQKLNDGHEHFINGLVALASGDATEAGRLSLKARKKLGTTTSTQFLQAHAAHLAGDHSTARSLFASLAENNDTAALGYRGLILAARQRDDWDEVEKLVEKLYRLKPETPWINLVRFDLMARRKDWQQAISTLSNISAARLLKPQQINTYRSAVLVAMSLQEALTGQHSVALQYAEQAFKYTPQWIVSTINLARQQMASGHKRAAQRTISKHWLTHPHPELALIYTTNISDPFEAYKKLQKLCDAQNDNSANQFVLAQFALAANIWGEARRLLTGLIDAGNATQSVYRMLARLERLDNGGESLALQWLTKSMDAPPDPVWLCHSCGGSHRDWQPTCRYCGGFNTLDWQSPGLSHKPADSSFLLTYAWSE